VVPDQSGTVVGELSSFLVNREVVGWLLLATMLFFSSLAFTVLENAMSVTIHHRVAIRRRHFMVSAFLPYAYILALGIGLLLVTLVAGSLQAMGREEVVFLGYRWSIGGMSGVLLYLLGLSGEVFVLTSIYLVMPVGRLTLRHALMGAVVAAVLWELTCHALLWYFATLSQISTVYGSLRDRRAAEPRAGGRIAPAGCTSDRGARAQQQGTKSWGAGAAIQDGWRTASGDAHRACHSTTYLSGCACCPRSGMWIAR
jgi:Virulence factor BrkB